MRDSVTIEIGSVIQVHFKISSQETFDQMRNDLKMAVPQAKGDVQHRCHIVPKNDYNINMVLRFCYSRFPNDCVFVSITQPVAA
jgi:hypothetical protein